MRSVWFVSNRFGRGLWYEASTVDVTYVYIECIRVDLGK